MRGVGRQFFGRGSDAALVLGVVLTCALVGLPRPAAGATMKRETMRESGELVPFARSPYPFTDGRIPGDGGGSDTPFFQTDTDGRRYHLAPRGGKLFEAQTYNDDRSLIYAPPRFNPGERGAFIVLFLHGNLANLSRDVAMRQGVPRQLRASQRNAVLVAPQLAVDALDSSPGRFYERGFFDAYVEEAARHIAERSGHRYSAESVDALPIVIVAYSGGYLATAFSLHYAMPRANRIRGVILLDALFGEEQKFEHWLKRPETQNAFFVSAYSNASAPLNRSLEAALGSGVKTSIPPTIGPGDVVFRPVPGAVHNDFVTQAWTRDPLADLLRRIRLDPAGQ